MAVLQLDHVRYNEQDLPGAVWVSVLGHPDVKLGDIATISGKTTPGFGVLGLTIFTAKVIGVVHPQTGDIGRVVRDWFADAIRKGITELHASLGWGI